jgi:hypothetical protein
MKRMLEIPPLLYTFWSGREVGPVVRMCWQSMRLHFPGHRLIILSSEDLPPAWQLSTLSPQIKADYARIDALAKTGGVWMDASCFLFNDSWVANLRELPDSTQVIGFGAPWDGNVLENWALAAPANSPFMSQWRDEFELAKQEQPAKYCQRVRNQLPVSLIPHLPYLASHAAAAVVRHRFPPASVKLLPSAPCGPFAVHSKQQWSAGRTALYLVRQPAAKIHSLCGSFCKLRGVERDLVDRILRIAPFIVHGHSIFRTPWDPWLAVMIMLIGIMILIRRSWSS